MYVHIHNFLKSNLQSFKPKVLCGFYGSVYQSFITFFDISSGVVFMNKILPGKSVYVTLFTSYVPFDTVLQNVIIEYHAIINEDSNSYLIERMQGSFKCWYISTALEWENPGSKYGDCLFYILYKDVLVVLLRRQLLRS